MVLPKPIFAAVKSKLAALPSGPSVASTWPPPDTPVEEKICKECAGFRRQWTGDQRRCIVCRAKLLSNDEAGVPCCRCQILCVCVLCCASPRLSLWLHSSLSGCFCTLSTYLSTTPLTTNAKTTTKYTPRRPHDSQNRLD